MNCLYEGKGPHHYEFDKEGTIINCSCLRCRAERYNLRTDRDYENEIDGPDGILAERAAVDAEREKYDRENEYGEREELLRLLKRGGIL